MNVLVTRPEKQGQALVELLNQQQIFALHQPLFTIEAGRELPQLPSVIARLNAGDYVFAVSRYAVEYAAQTLRQVGFHWRADLHYFAVGQQSALHFCGCSEQAVRFPIQSENSEGLLKLPEFQHLQGKNILILRAETGRELIAQQSIARGANVHYLECYRRVPIDTDIAEQISLCKRVGIDTIVVTSGEILTALHEQTPDEYRPWLFECKMVVVGSRLARSARALGWQNEQIVIANRADNQSLLDTLIKLI